MSVRKERGRTRAPVGTNTSLAYISAPRTSVPVYDVENKNYCKFDVNTCEVTFKTTKNVKIN